MQRVFEMMGNAIAATWAAVVPVLADVPLWAWIALALLAVAWVAVRRFLPGGRSERKPELFLARAELAREERDAPFTALIGFSNLHDEPVQLLALSAAGGDGQRAVVEATALIASQKAVELEADLHIGGAGAGWLELYLYVPSSRARAWRLRVPLAWVPFTQSYKAVPLKQTLAPVRELPEPPGLDEDRDPTPPPDARRGDGSRAFPEDF